MLRPRWGAATRLAAETGALYGYDPSDPREHLFMVGVLGRASAGTPASKLAAQRELHRLSQALARGAAWTTLDNNAITVVVTKLYQQLGERLTSSSWARRHQPSGC